MDGSLLDQQAAAVGFLVAFLLAVLLTPVVSQAAWRAGIVDTPTEERRLHARPTPLLGGLAIFAAIAIPAAALGNDHGFWGIIAGAALMAMLGALDDIHPLHPAVKLGGRSAIAPSPRFAAGSPSTTSRCRSLGVFDLGSVAVPGDDHLDRRHRQHRQLHRRHGRPGRRLLRDRRADVRHAGGVAGPRGRRRHLRRSSPGRPRLPPVQLPPGHDLHGRLRVADARLPAGRARDPGRAEDRGRRLAGASRWWSWRCRSSTPRS